MMGADRDELGERGGGGFWNPKCAYQKWPKSKIIMILIIIIIYIILLISGIILREGT